MKKENKKTLKVLCKILEVFAMIGKVMSIIAIPFLVMCMVLAPILINNIDIKDNTISIKGSKEKISIIETGKNNANIEVRVGDVVVAKEKEAEFLNVAKNMLGDVSKNKIVACCEIALTLGIASIVFGIIILSYTIKVFRNIRTEDTPFTEENPLYIRKIAYFMIASLVVGALSSVAIELIIGHDLSVNFSAYNIFEILLVFILSYIFEYGYELQKSSKKRISE